MKLLLDNLNMRLDLSNFHARKKDNIIQEIFACLTLYNFCESFIQNTIICKLNITPNYKINFIRASQVCRKFIRLFNTILFNVKALISNYLSVIRLDRFFNRTMKTECFTSFVYRVS